MKTIQEVYNGQEAVIICCSDVGWLLKSELALPETVCLCLWVCMAAIQLLWLSLESH